MASSFFVFFWLVIMSDISFGILPLDNFFVVLEAIGYFLFYFEGAAFWSFFGGFIISIWEISSWI